MKQTVVIHYYSISFTKFIGYPFQVAIISNIASTFRFPRQDLSMVPIPRHTLIAIGGSTGQTGKDLFYQKCTSVVEEEQTL